MYLYFLSDRPRALSDGRHVLYLRPGINEVTDSMRASIEALQIPDDAGIVQDFTDIPFHALPNKERYKRHLLRSLNVIVTALEMERRRKHGVQHGQRAARLRALHNAQ